MGQTAARDLAEHRRFVVGLDVILDHSPVDHSTPGSRDIEIRIAAPSRVELWCIRDVTHERIGPQSHAHGESQQNPRGLGANAKHRANGLVFPPAGSGRPDRSC